LSIGSKEAGFTIRQKMQSGDYSVVQGIFNKETNEVVGEGVKYEAKDVCDELKDGDELRIYT
jgi:hypothetical protein